MRKKVKQMRVRYIAFLTAALFCVMLVTGLAQKGTYTNSNDEERPLENFETGILSDSVLEKQMEVMSSQLQAQPMILAVTCVSDYYFRYGCATQKVKVNKVFVGAQLKEGAEISLLMSKMLISMENEEMLINGRPTINMGFRNQMKIGNTYLVFLSNKLEYSEEPIYLFSDDFIVNPVFDYDDIINKPLESEVEGAYFIPYKEAKDNEFFFNSQASIDKFAAFKKELIGNYPLDAAAD